jgi:streptogramin lyase
MYRQISALLTVFLTGGAVDAIAQTARVPAIASYDGASEVLLRDPRDLALGPDGRLYVSDTGNNRIVVMDPDTLTVLTEFGGVDLVSPHDISFGPDGRAYVADTGRYRVAIFRAEGDEWVYDEEDAIGVPVPEGVLAHSNGALYVTSSGAGVVVVYRDGEVVAALRGFSRPHDIIDDGEGGVWVADSGNNRFVRLSADFKVAAVVDNPALGLGGPRYGDVTAGGLILAADKFSDRIKLIDPAEGGRLVAMLGDPDDADQTVFLRPNGAEAAESVFYFADGSGRVIRYRLLLN